MSFSGLSGYGEDSDSRCHHDERRRDWLKTMKMCKPGLTAYEFLDLTDSEESSSSSDMQVFERNEAFVLELHELQRDELPDNPLPEVKTRKLLKKKKRGQLPATEHSESSLPSSSLSDSSVAPVGSDAKEEFYDAHESYHALPAHQVAAAVTSTAVMKVISDAPKPSPPAQAPPAPQPAEVKLPTAVPPPPPALEATRDPSTTVTKPVTPTPK